jgi:hypothetical protein
VGGYLVGYLWFPRRVSTYHSFWIPAYTAFLGTTFIRQIYMGISGKIRGRPAAPLAGHGAEEAHA